MVGEGADGLVLDPEDLKISIVSADGYIVTADGYLKVALDLTLSDDLLAEGNARELVNRVQNLRKSAGLVVTDRIALGISKNPESQRALKKYEDFVKNETLAVQITEVDGLDHSLEFDLNGIKTTVALKKI